jgi:hypothetical protein
VSDIKSCLIYTRAITAAAKNKHNTNMVSAPTIPNIDKPKYV